MSHKLIEQPTPLAVAAAALAAADAEMASIAEANRPDEDRLGTLLEQFDTECLSKGSRATAKLQNTIAALAEQVRPGRARLDAAKQRQARMQERLDSETRAIALAKANVHGQQQRVTRQREILAIAGKVVGEKKVALDRELGMLGHFERELSKLISPEEER